MLGVETKYIQNKLVNALLEAIFDVLDRDGKLSILNYAKLDYMKEPLPSEGSIPMGDFERLIDAMNMLLAFSGNIMFEVGRKFSFYLTPFGMDVLTFIDKINGAFGGLVNINVVKADENEIVLAVNRCPFCEGYMKGPFKGAGFSCQFLRGFFYETVLKSDTGRGGNISVEHVKRNNMCEFIIRRGSRHRDRN